MSSADSAGVASSSLRSPSSASQQHAAASGTTEQSHAPISRTTRVRGRADKTLDRGQFIASPPLSQRSSERKLSGRLIAQEPNQRRRRVETKRSFSPASSRDGPKNGAIGDAPERKSASTLPTNPSPNSM